MTTTPTTDIESEIERFLIQAAHDFRHDPAGFARFAWPGLELKEWQSELLGYIGEKLREGELTTQEVIQTAIASGHGIGKSAVVAILILWAITTESDTIGVVTANTENQLKTKTWAELSRWYNKFRYKHWFKFTATALFSSDPEHEKHWRIDMIPWSERNTEAFAGLHNKGKRILLIFDEASAIPDAIWEVSEGALTDEHTEIIWAVFGNPTRNTGSFYNCFGKFRHRWRIRNIDSRNVEGTNKAQIQKWIEDYGEDSDFVKVRVRGEFPSAGTNQLISTVNVEVARRNQLHPDEFMSQPVIIGVDVARFGTCESVICARKGRKQVYQKAFLGLDTVQLAMRIAEAYRDLGGSGTIIVEENGVGGGVIDTLRNLGYPVVGLISGKAAEDKDIFFNNTAESWFKMMKWFELGADIIDDPILAEQLTSREYFYTSKSQLRLQDKEDLEVSPDRADALAITFAHTVHPNVIQQSFEPSHEYS